MKKESSKEAIKKKLGKSMSEAIQKSIDEGLDPKSLKKCWALENLRLVPIKRKILEKTKNKKGRKNRSKFLVEISKSRSNHKVF